MNHQREAYFDNAKWMLIILVVFGHIISPVQDENPMLYTLYTTIYVFHMAGFILISGYFAKNFHQKGYLLKIARKTLVPYLVFQMMYALFYYGIDLVSGKNATLDTGLFMPHYTLWFLLSLFGWNVLLFVFAKFKWWTVWVAFALGIAVGYVDEMNKFLSLARTFVFFPFFLLGYYLKPEFFKNLRNRRWQIAGAAVLASLSTTFYFYSPENSIKWLECAFSYASMGTGGWLAGMTRLVQYVMMTAAALGFLALVPNKHMSFTIRGTRTLYVYLLHGFVIQAYKQLVPDDMFDILANHILLLMLAALTISFLLASKHTKKIARPLIELRI